MRNWNDWGGVGARQHGKYVTFGTGDLLRATTATTQLGCKGKKDEMNTKKM
jgi:N6-adenosine-specific RNA methylase IME4